MDDISSALAAQHRELAGIVDGCTADDWERPTRCVGWDVASVLVHLAVTDELATASARGDLDGYADGFLGSGVSQSTSVDDAAAAQVDADRGAGGPAIRERWSAATEEMRAAFAAGDPHQRVTWVSGRLSLQTLATTRLSECWIHTDDIASALGIQVPPTDRLRPIARLAWRTLPYAFERAGLEMHGPVALELVGPNGEEWCFAPDVPALSTIRGSAAAFCEVAARRVEPDATELVGVGPDADEVLRLVRTYAQQPDGRRGEVIANIRGLVDRARAAAVPVVWIQHSNDEHLTKETAGWEYVPELQRDASEPLVHERYGDAFGIGAGNF